MFIKNGRTWYGGTEQRSRGLYLLAACSDERGANGLREIRAIARVVTLYQCGHFMMGHFRVGSHKVSISGGLGDDSLPKNQGEVPAALWEAMVPVPEDVAEKFWRGSSSSDLGDWARANEAALTKRWDPRKVKHG